MDFYTESVTLDDCITMAKLNYHCNIKQGQVVNFIYEPVKDEVKEIFKEWVTLNQKQ